MEVSGGWGKGRLRVSGTGSLGLRYPDQPPQAGRCARGRAAGCSGAKTHGILFSYIETPSKYTQWTIVVRAGFVVMNYMIILVVVTAVKTALYSPSCCADELVSDTARIRYLVLPAA